MVVLPIKIQRCGRQQSLVRGRRSCVTQYSCRADEHGDRRNAETHLKSHGNHDDADDWNRAPRSTDAQSDNQPKNEHCKSADKLGGAEHIHNAVDKAVNVAVSVADIGITGSRCHNENDRGNVLHALVDMFVQRLNGSDAENQNKRKRR